MKGGDSSGVHGAAALFITLALQAHSTVASGLPQRRAGHGGGPPTALDVAGWAAEGRRVLFVTAHPDDIEGFAGGLAAALQQTKTVNMSYLVVTTGDAGGRCYDDWGPRPGPPGFRVCEKEELAFTRRREMVTAAALMGVPRPQVYRLGVSDGMVLAHHETELRRGIAAVVRAVQPHVVLTHYPYPNLAAQPTCNGACPAPASFDDMGFHPDHQRVGWHVLNTCYGSGSAAANNLIFDDLAVAGVPKWSISELYFFAMPGAGGVAPITHYLELSPELLSRKMNASSAHRSQYQDQFGELNASVSFWAGQSGHAVGVPYAEAFVGYF